MPPRKKPKGPPPPQGSYIADCLNKRALPTAVTFPLGGGQFLWIKLEHLTVSLLQKQKFVASVRYFAQPLDKTQEFPVETGAVIFEVIRGKYAFSGESCIFHPDAHANPAIPVPVKAVVRDKSLHIALAFKMNRRNQRILVDLIPHEGWE